MPGRQIVILGSTGSIGQSALEVIDHLGDRFEILALSANSSWRKLLDQVRRFKPRYVALADAKHLAAFRNELKDYPVRIIEGDDALVQLARLPEADIILNAVVGAAGMPAALATVDAGKRLALANKEALVMAGNLVMDRARQTGAEVLPVDSEHSAIFQALSAGKPEEVRRIIITASGGPFRQTPLEKLQHVTPQEALAHPTWDMGPKITIDSATMMNKALEIIEARWLFNVPAEQINVIVHPESIVHSLVEFRDGSVVAQLGRPDMKLPIQYALTWPERFEGPADRLDLAGAGRLNFFAPDLERFPALELGFEVARRGGTSGAVLNAANEEAVAAYLSGRIGFVDIVRIVRNVLNEHATEQADSVDKLLAADRWARKQAGNKMK